MSAWKMGDLVEVNGVARVDELARGGLLHVTLVSSGDGWISPQHAKRVDPDDPRLEELSETPCAISERLVMLVGRKTALSLVAIAPCAVEESLRVEQCTNGSWSFTPDKLRGIIAFARQTWRDDGAEGETVHRLCDVLEARLEELDEPAFNPPWIKAPDVWNAAVAQAADLIEARAKHGMTVDPATLVRMVRDTRTLTDD